MNPLYPRSLLPPKCPAVAAEDSCFRGRTNLSCRGELCMGVGGFGGSYSLKPMILHFQLCSTLWVGWSVEKRWQTADWGTEIRGFSCLCVYVQTVQYLWTVDNWETLQKVLSVLQFQVGANLVVGKWRQSCTKTTCRHVQIHIYTDSQPVYCSIASF